MEIQDLNVIICDDSLLARKNLHDGLTKLGCKNVTEVMDGQQAVDAYKKKKADVVFLDIVMPVMDGISAAGEICNYDKDAYVIMVSSVGTQLHLREAIKAGARDFLQKPTTPEQIREALSHILGGDS
ncbi:MAG: response regulator [Lachnospiraceae bacterium]|nr:response regulator [Lachnospiraceae bacterium]